MDHVHVKADMHIISPVTHNWFCLFDLILYAPVNSFSDMSGRVFLGWTRTKQGLICLAEGHNTVMTVRLEPATPWSPVKHSTSEPLHFHWQLPNYK